MGLQAGQRSLPGRHRLELWRHLSLRPGGSVRRPLWRKGAEGGGRGAHSAVITLSVQPPQLLKWVCQRVNVDEAQSQQIGVQRGRLWPVRRNVCAQMYVASRELFTLVVAK